MSWNSRIFVEKHPIVVDGDNKLDGIYGMRETYYNDKGQVVAWDDGFYPILADTPEGLIEALRQQLKDAEKSLGKILDADMEPEGREERWE